MAAAAAISFGVPLVAELAVRLVEKFLGPKTGAIKKPTAAAVLLALGQGMVNAGQATAGQIPDAASAPDVIQKAVDSLNAAGELKGAATVLAPADTIDKTDARSMLRLLESIAPTLVAK